MYILNHFGLNFLKAGYNLNDLSVTDQGFSEEVDMLWLHYLIY